MLVVILCPIFIRSYALGKEGLLKQSFQLSVWMSHRWETQTQRSQSRLLTAVNGIATAAKGSKEFFYVLRKTPAGWT